MPMFDNDVFDSGLGVLTANVDKLCYCSADPTTYTQAVTTYMLGYKDTPTVGAVGDRTGGGRKVTVSAVTDGVVSTGGTATHWALVKVGTTKLYAAGALAASKVLSTSFAVASDAFDVGMADPT